MRDRVDAVVTTFMCVVAMAIIAGGFLTIAHVMSPPDSQAMIMRCVGVSVSESYFRDHASQFPAATELVKDWCAPGCANCTGLEIRP